MDMVHVSMKINTGIITLDIFDHNILIINYKI